MAPRDNLMILLDTNILIEVFKGNATVTIDVREAGSENLALSSVTAMELY
jgi:predicted nucleic acid-binding protein